MPSQITYTLNRLKDRIGFDSCPPSLAPRYSALLTDLIKRDPYFVGSSWHIDPIFSWRYYEAAIASNNECHFCSGDLFSSERAHGVGKIDNQKPHSANNILPVCWFCNRIQGGDDGLRYDEMLLLAPALRTIRSRRQAPTRHNQHTVRWSRQDKQTAIDRIEFQISRNPQPFRNRLVVKEEKCMEHM